MLLLAGCTEPDSSDEPAPPVANRRAAAIAVLGELRAAVVARDAAAAARLAAPGDDAARSLLGDVVDNARDLRVRDFSIRLVDEDLTAGSSLPEGQWAAAVDTAWAFGGFDRAPAQTEVTFTFAQDGEEVYVAGIGGGDRPSPLWLSAPLSVERTASTLVMVAGSAREATRYAGLARRAVPIVQRVLPAWRAGLVVEVPSSVDALDRTLGAKPGEYAAIAAVTTSGDGSLAPKAPVHVFVNPTVFGRLKPDGAQVVMSHEATHIATDAVRAATPLWLLEGFADYVALRDVDLPLEVTAGQIISQVRKDGAPAALPGPTEFDTGTTHLGASYEAAWLAVRLLAATGGEPAVVALYRRASQGESVDTVLQELFGFGEKEFTRRWRTELETIAR